MKRININLDSSIYNSSSRGNALSSSGFSLNETYSYSSSNEWLLDYIEAYHMANDKSIFSTLNECNTTQIFVGDDRSLSVVGSKIVQLDDGHFNDVLCVPSLFCNLLSVYQTLIKVKGNQ
jgi:hypothetical protein